MTQLASNVCRPYSKVWDADSGKYLRTMEFHKGWVTDLMYYHSYRYLLSCSAGALYTRSHFRST